MAALLALPVMAASAGLAVAAPKTPDTRITASPTSPTNSQTATFSFTSTIAGSTFACQVDGGAWLACSSPRQLTGVAAGGHTFAVRATAGGLTDASPATASWTVDLTSPTVPVGLAATTPSTTSVALTWTASTDNVAVAGYSVYRGGTLVGSPTATSFTDTGRTPGTAYTYTVVARDTAGNISASSTPVTATTPTPQAPDTVVDSAPAAYLAATNASIAFHSTVTPATFTCALDSAAATSCTSPVKYNRLSAGSHTVRITATSGGLADLTPAVVTFVVDTTAPSVPGGLVADASGYRSVALRWNASSDANGIDSYEVLRGGVVVGSGVKDTRYTDATGVSGTAYSYTVRARDLAGNTSAVSTAVSGTPVTPTATPQLTRWPYLTDLVGRAAIVNFATDRSASAASVAVGTVTGTTCSLSGASPTVLATVPASRTSITVNSTPEYQWKAKLSLPSAGTYCYRPSLGTLDLLGTAASPSFRTQVPLGQTAPWSFAVFGDWGEVDASGANAAQAAVMDQIASGDTRFAVTTGDNGYPAGSQGNLGDLQQVGANTSGVFGPAFWARVGATIPVFPIIGNHGMFRNDAVHPHFASFPQDTAVATSGGSYQIDTYPSVNGTTAVNLPSAWYAVDAGNVRLYMLTASWPDTNNGTADPYTNDVAQHWTPSSPEYQWLKADLEAHPSNIKLAFFHYPMNSDQPSENSDAALRDSLGPLLASNGVRLGFSGHAHIYQRSAPLAGGPNLTTYVTGGGGASAQSIGACSANTAYAVGWSDTLGGGQACGAAPVPTSSAQVYHYLRVTIDGTKVTVTPIDSTGRIFDAQTYTVAALPETYLDTSPDAGTSSTTASFTFHASAASATYRCSLDGATPVACTSPVTYQGLASGPHTFSVVATVGGVADPKPATWSWTVDTVAPAAPTALAVTAPTAFSTSLSWIAATDDLGVTAYDVYRNGSLLTTLGAVTSYTDTTVLANTTYSYALVAKDVAGNASPASAPAGTTTGAPGSPVFADGFETGSMSRWTVAGGLSAQGAVLHAGQWAAEGVPAGASAYAKKTLPAEYPDTWTRAWFNRVSGPDQTTIVRLRDASDASLAYVFVTDAGEVAVRNDATASTRTSATTVPSGWHALEVHRRASSAAGVADGALEVWLDNVRLADISSTAVDTGAASTVRLQIGEVQAGTYDVFYDDVAIGTERLGPAADVSAPTTPTGVTATAASPFSVTVGWVASTDDVAVSGYDVLRDGSVVASVPGPVTSWTDDSALASTAYTYTVVAKDASGNASSPSSGATVTTPAAPAPVFVDGFESGDLSAWNAGATLAVQSATTHSGTSAAEGTTTAGARSATRTLPGSYPDAYGRTWFSLASQSSQVNLLRLRAGTTNIATAYVSTTGRLGLATVEAGTTTSRTSSVVVGAGWHSVELHAAVAGAASSVEVWLDGVKVPSLSPAGIDLGTSSVTALVLGDTAATGTYSVFYDDAAFGISRIGVGGDVTAPSVPASVTATAVDGFTVALTWAASTDDTGVTGYEVRRDGVAVATLAGDVSAWTDTTVQPSTQYAYTVRALDAAGNRSAQSDPVAVGTPAAQPPLFSDGFESGTLTGWTNNGLSLQTTGAAHGGFALGASPVGVSAYAQHSAGAALADAYARTAFKVSGVGSQTTLLRLRPAAGSSVGYVYVTAAGRLGAAYDGSGATTNLSSTVAVADGAWHVLELHLAPAATTAEVWLDGAKVAALSSSTVALGAATIGVVQVGDSAATTATFAFDDVATSSSRIGGGGDFTAPTDPGSPGAVADSAFQVTLTWTASTDDVAVAGYELLRDGAPLAVVASGQTSYVDTTALNATGYTYGLRAYDAAGNRSGVVTATATTPAAAAPLFADGFESGGLTAWTSASATVSAQQTSVRTGAWAAGVTAAGAAGQLSKTLPATQTNVHGRVGFSVTSQTSTVTLVRFRAGTTAVATLGLTAGKKLTGSGSGWSWTSAGTVGTGWHLAELHISTVDNTVEVWLDGAPVAGTTASAPAFASAAVSSMAVGDSAAVTYSVAFDDAAVSTSRIGL